MKKKWDSVCGQLEKVEASVVAFLEYGGLSSNSIVKSKAFIKELNAYKDLVADFDTYMSPVDPLTIDFPFESEEMKEIWQRWKEYLVEQHGQLMRTRSEKSSLEHLKDISKNNEDKAIKFLRYAMTNRYKNFFAIEEKDTKQPSKEDTCTGSSFG